MLKNRLILLVAAALGSACLLIRPVGAGERALDPERRAFAGVVGGIQRLKSELNLTREQQERLEKAWRDVEVQLQDIREDKLLSPAEQEAKVFTLRRGLDTGIKALLTADQNQTYDQLEGLSDIKNLPWGVTGLWRELTEAQQDAIHGVIAESRAAFEAAGENAEKVQKARQASWPKIIAALTPGQQQRVAAAIQAVERERAASEREHDEK
jgi:hypothetical protein